MTLIPRRRRAPIDGTELARLLPAPTGADLSSHRHDRLKEYLMTEIQRDDATPAKVGRPLRRLAFAVPVAVAAAAAVTIGLTVHGSAPHGQPGAHRPAATSTAAPTSAATLLGRISLAAEHEPATAVRDDQFIYVDSTVAFTVTNGETKTTTLGKLHRRQVWLSADGRRAGLLDEKGDRTPLDADDKPATLNGPTYKYLTGLPTDPDVLLKKIYDETKGAGTSPDDEAFVTIGDLIRESLVPPKLAAALYRAAAKIPGVTVVNDVTDAAGRHGVAVSRTQDGGTEQWIFDRHGLQFLGERELAGTGLKGVKPGTVVGSSAVLDRAVVDRAGQSPAK